MIVLSEMQQISCNLDIIFPFSEICSDLIKLAVLPSMCKIVQFERGSAPFYMQNSAV